MKKRIVSLALALALLIGMMPMVMIEADAYSTSEIVEAALQLLYYNEGSYGSINKDDNGAVSVGKIQWHGNRALNLLKTIVNMDESAAESILGTTLFKEIKTSSNWSTRTVTSAEATALSNLLTTANGKSAQDALATSDVTVYINHGQNLGITDAASLIYFADMENQGGYGMSSRVAKAAAASAGSYGAITLAILHNAALADSVAGDYATRRNRTYNYCLDYVTNDGCVITFRANGGTCATTTMSVEEGNAIGTLPTANFEGMCFEGWYTEPFGGTQVTVATVPSRDMTLYAHYSYIPSQVKLNFDPNGGTLPDAVLTETVDGINIGRPGESLVIFNQSGTKPGTNIYGKEIAVNSQGKITAVREYGDETQLTVPNGGFILSGQQGWDSNAGVSTGGAMFVKQIIAMEEAYVSLNYETGEVKVFDSYAGYLAETKRGQEYTTYGVLPVPMRDGYVFEGWEDDYGKRVNYYSGFSGINLTAAWSQEGKLAPVATMEFGGHYYELYDNNVTWTKAKALCEAQGGYLVVVTSAAEQEAIADFITEGSRGLYRIGATDAASEGTWEWINGEAFSYSNWDQNLPEPSAGEGESYSCIIAIENAPNKQVGEWVDECDVFYGNFYDLSNTGFICEYDQVNICQHAYSYALMEIPTEERTGILRQFCEVCGKANDITLPVISDADYSYSVLVEPTCEGTGIGSYTWNNTSYIIVSIDVDLAKISHSYTSTSVAPTCTQQGYTNHVCSICGDTYADTPTPAVGHAYTTQIVLKPTETDTGILTVRCGNCSENISITLPVLSDSDYDYTLVRAPTAEQPGIGRYTWHETTYGEISIEVEIAALTDTASLYTYTVTDGQATITAANVSGDVTIPSTLDGYPVVAIGASVFKDNTSITSIVIPDSVTSIGANAFYNCSALSAVNIPDSVTYMGDWAFFSCEGLESVVIGNGVPSIRAWVFKNCTSLKSIHIGDGVTSIDVQAFQNCISLQTVTGNASLAKIYGGAFSGCSSLARIAFSTSLTNVFDSAFSGCTSLEDVYYSGSESEWNAVVIGDVNNPLREAIVHYNSTGEKVILYGDVNSDGKVNAQDRMYLTRYLAGMTGYIEGMIDMIAADVNRDGKVNTQDRMILTRYLAQWTAYPSLPHDP